MTDSEKLEKLHEVFKEFISDKDYEEWYKEDNYRCIIGIAANLRLEIDLLRKEIEVMKESISPYILPGLSINSVNILKFIALKLRIDETWTVQKIADAVSELTKFYVEEVLSNTRRTDILLVRYLIQYLACNFAGISASEVARFTSKNSNHSTVLHANKALIDKTNLRAKDFLLKIYNKLNKEK